MGNRYQQLSLSERVYIQAQLELGFKAAAIAAALKRSATTLSRELRRNRWKRTKRSPAKAERGPMPPIGYLADQARQRAASKAAKPRGEFRTEVIALLRHGHKKRRPRAQGRRGQIPNMISIAERPAKIADRLIPGHWEGYTIKGKYNRSAVGTLVERVDAQMRLSITYDRGKEMAKHEELTARTGIKVTSPIRTPWQRDTNENTNGLIR